MPFPQKDAEQLKEEINAILDKQSASAVERAKAILLRTELLVGSKSEMIEVRKYLDQRLEKFPHKALVAPILRLIDIHLASNVNVPDSNGKTLLYWALQMGDESSLELLVQVYHANINAVQDGNGSTFLHLAAKAGNLERARQLIETCWATVDVQDSEGNTPLFDAIKAGNLPLVKFLVEKGANVNAVNKAGNTPLHMAAAYAPINVLRFLMTKTALVNVQNKAKETPLHWAAQKGRVSIVAALIKDYRANITLDSDGKTLLCHAVQSGSEDMVNYLLNECGVPIEGEENTWGPLWTAAYYGRTSIVRLLVKERKVDVDTLESNGATPLHAAAEGGHLDTVRYLIEDCKADINIMDDNDNDTALSQAAANGHLLVVRWLVEKYHMDVNGSGTPLLAAVVHKGTKEGNKEVIKYLLKKGARPEDAMDSEGATALQRAYGCYEGCKPTHPELSAKILAGWKLLKDFSVNDELAAVVKREVSQAFEDDAIEEYMTVSAEQQYIHTSLSPEIIPDLKAMPASVKQRLAHIKQVELGLLQLAEGLSDKATPTEGRRNRIHTAAEKVMNTLEDQEDCRKYWQLLKENCNKGAAFLAAIPRPSEPDTIPLPLTSPAITPAVTLPLSLTVSSSSSSSLSMRPESPGGKEEIKEGRTKALPPIPMEEEDFNRAITASLSPSRNTGKDEEKEREKKSEKEYKDVAAVSHSSASSNFGSRWWWNPEMSAVPTLAENKREQRAVGQNNYSDSVIRLFSTLSRDANGKKKPTAKNKIAQKRKAKDQTVEGTPNSVKQTKRQDR